MRNTLCAYTTGVPIYPPYFNATEEGGAVTLTIRHSPMLIAGRVLECGATSSITLPKAVVADMFREALKCLD